MPSPGAIPPDLLRSSRGDVPETSPAIRSGHRRDLAAAGVVLAVTVIVFAGFARTYYLKSLFGAPSLSVLLHLHGLTVTGWLLIFGLQVWLVRTQRVPWHRKMGVFAAGWFLATLIISVATTLMAGRLGRSPVPAIPPLVFMAIPLGDAVVFGGLVIAGLACVRRPAAHRRLMLLSCFALLPPAIGRLPFAFCHTPAGFMGLTDGCMLAWIVHDTIRQRRLHPAYGWGALFVMVSQPVRLAVSGTPAWLEFATWLTR